MRQYERLGAAVGVMRQAIRARGGARHCACWHGGADCPPFLCPGDVVSCAYAMIWGRRRTAARRAAWAVSRPFLGRLIIGTSARRAPPGLFYSGWGWARRRASVGKALQMELGLLLGLILCSVVSKLVCEKMAAFAAYIHEKIGLSSNLAEHLQNQNPLDHNRLRVLNESRIEDGQQFVTSPSKWIAVPNQVQVQVKRRFYNHSRRQLFANAAIASSRVAA
jgi:hypothetical protein